MERYRRVLRAPHVARLWAVTTIARLPIAINGLAIVLAMREETGSFAAAGALGRSAPLYAAAGAMALTRPYLGVHYPSDVVAGAALGVALERLL